MEIPNILRIATHHQEMVLNMDEGALFHTHFYGNQEIQRYQATIELYQRGWRFYKPLNLWLTTIPELEGDPSVRDLYFYYFNTKIWRRTVERFEGVNEQYYEPMPEIPLVYYVPVFHPKCFRGPVNVNVP